MKKQAVNPFLPLWEYIPMSSGTGSISSDPMTKRAETGTVPRETMQDGAPRRLAL